MAESQQMEQSLQVVMEHEVVQAQLSEMLDGDLMKSFRENMAPIRALMSRYRCAMMEVETKFKVLNEQFSLEHDRNRIESIKTRLKSMDSILEKLHRRDLPWRRDREPYHIWVSEIMLQQTRVEAVRGYYARFLEALPTVADLAKAPDDGLGKLWEGLGYYSRMRNLRAAAQVVQEKWNGQIPRDYDAVRSLPGIGDYTAGAICSIAFDMPTPAVDGNVLRVLARVLADSRPVDLPAVRREAREALAAVYPEGRCGDFTQALMELGATVCIPNGAPQCGRCPLADLCQARATGQWRELPCRLPKRKRRQEDWTVFILDCGGRFALEQRGPSGLLAGLWQFPNVPGTLGSQAALDQAARWGTEPTDFQRSADRTHIFTHIQWNLRCCRIVCRQAIPAFRWMTAEEIRAQVPLPTAFRQFLDFL